MSLQVGLVGFPNVGKSTLFNALLQSHLADNANYPFCTIEPNIGIVKVPDARLDTLAKTVGISKIVNAAIKFIDIAGIVEGAHQGLGLGNKFLSHIREVDVLAFVLRDFTDDNVQRVGSKSPMDDFQILMTELELADLEILQKQKAPKVNVTKQDKIKWQAVTKLNKAIEAGVPLNQIPLTEAEQFSVKSFSLLTLKPMIIVLNSDEETLSQEQPQIDNYPTLRICASIEAQIAGLSENERINLLQLYNIKEAGLNLLISKAYDLLEYITFFTTTGNKEVRAWPIPKNTKAPQAAGTIHSDFESHFIKAKVATYNDFVANNGWTGLKNTGKIGIEGKDYIIEEGNVVEFVTGQ